jgi:hypothetical protein
VEPTAASTLSSNAKLRFQEGEDFAGPTHSKPMPPQGSREGAIGATIRRHLLVRRGDRTSTLPQHGGRKQLGKGLWSKILKDLGLKENR